MAIQKISTAHKLKKWLIRWLCFWRRWEQTVPALLGTKMRHRYGKKFTVLDVALRNLRTSRAYCKDDASFEAITSFSPTEFLIGLETGTIRCSLVEPALYLITVDKLVCVLHKGFVNVETLSFERKITSGDIIAFIEKNNEKLKGYV